LVEGVWVEAVAEASHSPRFHCFRVAKGQTTTHERDEELEFGVWGEKGLKEHAVCSVNGVAGRVLPLVELSHSVPAHNPTKINRAPLSSVHHVPTVIRCIFLNSKAIVE
jgi:hypothetical protein